ncbi:MAG: ABC transporter permease [Pseudanabaenaceae cyanobacterium]
MGAERKALLPQETTPIPAAVKGANGQWGWLLAAAGLSLLSLVPLGGVAVTALTATGKTWQHLTETVLGEYLTNSLLLAVGVGIVTLVLGTTTAWLTTMCRFPGSPHWAWALLLPLSAPGYLLAYTYAEFLDFAGPVQTALRATWGADVRLPPIRSLGGAIVVLALASYPYVYLLARNAFLEEAERLTEASRLLGCGPWRSFALVSLPVARPSLAAGTALVLMETLSDYGAVAHFGVDTLATGIYRTWFALGDRPASAQLATVLAVVVFAVLALETVLRQRRRFERIGTQAFEPPFALRGGRAIGALAICSLPVLLGFVLPVGLLVQMALLDTSEWFAVDFWRLTGTTLSLGLIAGGLAAIAALVLAWGKRLAPSPIMGSLVRVAILGYAIPGSTLAVGLLPPLGWLDSRLSQFLTTHFGRPPGLVLGGTLFILVFAYLVRFLAVGFNAIEGSLLRIGPSLDEASRLLGCSPLVTLWRVHLPLLRGGIFSGMLLVFVDVMKELPATLVLHPVNLETLAVRTHQYAADERLAAAAAPALTIIAAGLLPVLLLSWQIARSRRIG